MKPIEFFRDGNGSPHARGSDTQMATFLMTDCQSSVSVIDELLAMLDAETPSGQFVGNGHHVEIDGSRVGIEPLHAEPDETHPVRHLSTVYFRETVQRWKAFIMDTDDEDQTQT